MRVTRSSQFKKDYKLAEKQHKNIELFIDVINKLSKQEKLLDHKLSGIMRDYRELHLAPDWLLIYKVDCEENELKLARLGSHAQLFKK